MVNMANNVRMSKIRDKIDFRRNIGIKISL